MAARAGSSFAKNWLRDPSTYPIIGIITFASAMCTAASVRYAARGPDVQWNKEARGAPIRENVNESAAFYRGHREKLAHIKANALNGM